MYGLYYLFSLILLRPRPSLTAHSDLTSTITTQLMMTVFYHLTLLTRFDRCGLQYDY